MAKYFTLDEANRAVEEIRPLMARILEIRQALLDGQSELGVVLENHAANGGSRAASQAAEGFRQMESLIQRIQATGAEVKDINSGLLDFLALREGREVYLCWQYGEDRIRFWHDLEAGFAGRQPLE